MSEESKKKMSEARRGEKHFRFGKHLSEEHKRKLSEANKGKKRSEEARKKISDTHKGPKPWLCGKSFSEERKYKISESRKGQPSPMKGKHQSEETKKKMRESHLREKSSLWRGGASFEQYTMDWMKTLKRSIRERDKYICQLCNDTQGDTSFDVHHIDYDKKNCNPNNLITLCKSCHRKTNFNRNHWIKYFEVKKEAIKWLP